MGALNAAVVASGPRRLISRRAPASGGLRIGVKIVAGFVLTTGAGGFTVSAAPLAEAPSATGLPAGTAERPVHRFLQVETAPDGAHVASVEGDSPRGGYHPEVRDLIIRRVVDGVETRIDLPCGRVPQCWPSSPAWSPDGKRLSFALRTPGSHAYAVYDVQPNGTDLTRRLASAAPSVV